jgi:hypothetical protein
MAGSKFLAKVGSGEFTPLESSVFSKLKIP